MSLPDKPSSPGDPPDLSVVVLCYREEENLVPFIAKLRGLLTSLEDSWELVLVGNYLEGSSDRTGEVIRQLQTVDPSIRSVIKPKEGMMGWDMRQGLMTAQGRYIAVMDGDGQFPLDSLLEGYRRIRQGHLDLVKTYRTRRDDGIYRRSISRVYNILFKVLFPGLPSRDVNSKPKILTRKAYESMDLHSDDWFIDAEIMLNVRRLGLRWEEFPITFYDIHQRKSFVKPAAILEFLKNLLQHRIREWQRPEVSLPHPPPDPGS